MTSELLPLYEDARYVVVVVDLSEDMDTYTDGRFQYDTAYAVVNKETGVW